MKNMMGQDMINRYNHQKIKSILFIIVGLYWTEHLLHFPPRTVFVSLIKPKLELQPFETG